MNVTKKFKRPCNCGENSTEDVAKKSKSDPRDEVPPGAEVEEVLVEPVFPCLFRCICILLVICIDYLNLYFVRFWYIFLCFAKNVHQVPVQGRMMSTTKKNGRDTFAIQVFGWGPNFHNLDNLSGNQITV